MEASEFIDRMNGPPYLGDYVRTTRKGYLGRVTGVYIECPEDEEWLALQDPPFTQDEIDDKWVGVLVDGGGAIFTPARDCTVVHPFLLINRHGRAYFRDSPVFPESGEA